jgi:tRNA-specific 2-thiouridylase
VTTNTIYVGQGEDHPGLWRSALFISEDDCHWVREDLQLLPGENKNYLVRIRYRQRLYPAQLIRENNGLYIQFEQPMKSITAGQFAAWYDNDELVGSGVIHE